MLMACVASSAYAVAGRVAEARAVAGDVATSGAITVVITITSRGPSGRTSCSCSGTTSPTTATAPRIRGWALSPARGATPSASRNEAAHGRKPTGRFSDGLVQSDFLAKIMGHSESPPPYTGDSDNWDDGIDASGMNFAVAEAGALEAPSGVLKLRAQVQQLRDLVRDGLVDDRDFTDSVALVAYSGND
jgi:hypothetical protein